MKYFRIYQQYSLDPGSAGSQRRAGSGSVVLCFQSFLLFFRQRYELLTPNVIPKVSFKFMKLYVLKSLAFDCLLSVKKDLLSIESSVIMSFNVGYYSPPHHYLRMWTGLPRALWTARRPARRWSTLSSWSPGSSGKKIKWYGSLFFFVNSDFFLSMHIRQAVLVPKQNNAKNKIVKPQWNNKFYLFYIA